MKLPEVDDVEMLVSGALSGMSKVAPKASSDEILSAAFTLLQRVIKVVLENPRANPGLIRQSIELLMLNTIGPRETIQ